MKFLFLSILLLISQSEAISQVSALRRAIFEDYDKLVKPDEFTNVNIKISFLNFQMWPHKQMLTTDSWFTMSWNDSRLTWNPEEWNGISSINIDATEFWLPDISLYNGEQVKPSSVVFNKSLPKTYLDSDGRICFVPSVTFHSLCEVPDNYNQTGEYHCSLIFGSWTYHQGLLDILPNSNLPKENWVPYDLTDFVNPQVEILEISFERGEVKFDYRHEIHPVLKYNIRFKQN